MGYYLVVANKIAHSFSFSSNEIMYFTFIHRPTVGRPFFFNQWRRSFISSAFLYIHGASVMNP